MTTFNVAGGAFSAKTQLTNIKEAIRYYRFTGTPIPNPLSIYAKDYRLLATKAKVVLKKKKISTENLHLFYDEIELKGERKQS